MENQNKTTGLYLCVRASDNSKQWAAAVPTTHQLLMICELKALTPTIININPNQKEVGGFKNMNTSGKLPALFCENGIQNTYDLRDDPEEIVDYLEDRFQGVQLKTNGKRALADIQRQSFMTKFRKFLNNSKLDMEETLRADLLLELQRLDYKLAAKKTKFLEGDIMKLADTYLLPILLLIRVAGKQKKFEIPCTFISLWQYIEDGEKTDAYQKHKPSDDLIRQHWCSGHGK